MKKGLFLIAAILSVVTSACGGVENPTHSPGASIGTQTADATVAATPAAPPLPDAPLAGPLVGLFIEDLYEDVYLSIFDAETGGFRVLDGGVSVYLGEAQWFDGGCRLFIHGQLTDLHGVPQWSIPEQVAAQIDSHEISRLSPGRNWLVHVVPQGIATGQGAAAADVEVISLVEPYTTVRLTERGGGDTRALAWSEDEAWVYYTDRDENGILQVYRAAPDGTAREQLTRHQDSPGLVSSLAPSPGGRYLAYGVRNLLGSVHPYTYQPADEGWVGVIELATGESIEVRPEKLLSAVPETGIVWDESGENFVIIGDSLPVGDDDPLAGRQVHWVTAAGDVIRFVYSADGPGGHIGWIVPLGGIDRLLVNVQDELYILQDGQFSPLAAGKSPRVGAAIGRRVIGVVPAPIGFPGEERCDPLQE